MKACVFGRAILAGYAECHRSGRSLEAEREATTCTHDPARERCRLVHENLCRGARFAWHLRADAPWPFGREMRVQCGGIVAIAELTGWRQAAPDIDRMLANAPRDESGAPALAYERLVRSIAAFRPRGAR